MYLGKLSQLCIAATLSLASLGGFHTAFGGELSSKAASELMAARQEYINAYQNLTNKSNKVNKMNKSAPSIIMGLTSSAEALANDLAQQCQADCMAIAESHDKMMAAKFEEKRSSLQIRIDEISNRFFSDAARQARWNQATQEVSHHFPNIEQEVAEIVKRKYAADFERAVEEARSAIQEEFSGALSEHRNALMAEYDRRFSEVLAELNARLTNEINQVQNSNSCEIDNMQRNCSAEQQQCQNRWQSAHRQRLNEIESWFSRRWDEIVNNPQYKMWGVWGQQAVQYQIQEAQQEAANAQRQSHERCQIQCNNELQAIVSRYQRAANEANSRARQRVSQVNAHYQSAADASKAELQEALQRESDAYAEALREEFSQRDLNSLEMQRIIETMSLDAEQQISERCELLIRQCFLSKEAQASDLCQSLMAAENQNAKIEWEQFQQEEGQKCLAQIASIEESYQKRLSEAQTRLYGAAGRIFEEYNQAQIAVNEAKRKFEEKGAKLVEAQSQEPNFMDELDEMEDSERTPSLLQALKEALVNGFKNAIPIWTPTKDAMTAMDAIATAAMEGRYEDIDENFNKVSQELANLMRDTNDARYGFVIKPMIFEALSKEVEKQFKEAGLSLPRNHGWANERVTKIKFLKDMNAKAEAIKDPQKRAVALEKIQTRAKIIEKYEHLNPEGIYWSAQGHPDFKPYAIKSENNHAIIVEIEMSNPENRNRDYRLAAKAALDKGLITQEQLTKYSKPAENDYFVWHHAEDGKTMVLMPRDLHKAIPHSGGISSIRNGSLQ